MTLSIKDRLGGYSTRQVNLTEEELDDYIDNIAKYGEKIIGIWD